MMFVFEILYLYFVVVVCRCCCLSLLLFTVFIIFVVFEIIIICIFYAVRFTIMFFCLFSSSTCVCDRVVGIITCPD